MKTPLIVLCSACLLLPATAQPDRERRARPERPERQRRFDGERPGGPNRQDRQGPPGWRRGEGEERSRRGEGEQGQNRGEGDQRQRRRGVERYLQRLKENQPEEFERMQKLRQEDPEAFRGELRKQVMQRREERGRPAQHPLKTEIQAVRQAETPEARDQAVEHLRQRVGELMDENLARREERIERVREQLSELEKRHQDEKQQRQELIDQHVQRLLENREGAPPDAPPPAP